MVVSRTSPPALLLLVLLLPALLHLAHGVRAQPPVQPPAAAAANTDVASAPLLVALGRARFQTRTRNPDPQIQTAGGDFGRDISKCNPGCDYTSGYRCCKEKCQDIELSCADA
jgi:hypothetical protein